MDCFDYIIHLFYRIREGFEIFKNWMNNDNFRRYTVIEKFD